MTSNLKETRFFRKKKKTLKETRVISLGLHKHKELESKMINKMDDKKKVARHADSPFKVIRIVIYPVSVEKR